MKTETKQPTGLVYTGATSTEIWPLVRNFHYSKRMPSNIQHCYAARESGGLFGDTGKVVAGIVFSIPPTRWSETVLELSRLVRSPDFGEPLTRLISFACKWLSKFDADLVVSFADWTQEHHGGIYQAASWNFSGKNEASMDGIIVGGMFIPGRSANSRWGTRSPKKLAEMNVQAEPHYDAGKYLYWKSLNKSGERKAQRIGLNKLPYPKPKQQVML